jgi:hypothetical protein
MPQLVGQICVHCRNPISSIFEGHFCKRCGCALHYDCAKPNSEHPDPNRCAQCGGDASLRLAPDFAGGLPSLVGANRSRGPQESSKDLQESESVMKPALLQDPLLTVRRFFRGTALVMFLIVIPCTAGSIGGCVYTGTSQSNKPSAPEEPGPILDHHTWNVLAGLSVFAVLAVFSFWFGTILMTAFMPRRRTAAFYLRSFRDDPKSWPVRIDIQTALGSKMRLSGIRDPKRRRMYIWDFINPVFLAMRYCTPKYMDLEARDDWQPRLWYSMREARCAFIDLRDLTGFVGQEITLAASALGVQRIAFIGDESRDEREWKNQAAHYLPSETAIEKLTILPWDKAPEKRAFFGQSVCQFAQSLKGLPPVSQNELPYWCGQPVVGDIWQSSAFRLITAFWILQFLFGVLGYFLPDLWEVGPTKTGLGFIIFSGANICLLTWHWALYIWDVGVPTERIKAAIGLVAWLGLVILAIWVIIQVQSPYSMR